MERSFNKSAVLTTMVEYTVLTNHSGHTAKDLIATWEHNEKGEEILVIRLRSAEERFRRERAEEDLKKAEEAEREAWRPGFEQ